MLLIPPKDILVKALNALFDREDWAKKKNRVHAGKTMAIVVSSWQILLTIMADGKVSIANDAVVPTVKLTLTQEALRELPKALKRKASVDELASFWHIEGDAGLAHLVSELVHDLRWDVEDELTRLLGPFMASVIVIGARDFKEKSKQLGEKGLEKASRFLKGEHHVIVQKTAMDAFKKDVQSLLHHVNQLERRISKLRGN